MLKEFIQAIDDLAVKASIPNELHPKSEPPHVYYMPGDDGGLTRLEAQPHPRSHTASSLDAILQYVNSAATPSTIWFNRQKVVGVLDDTTRRDVLTLSLVYTAQFHSLIGCFAGRTFDQRKLIRFLRIDLDGCQVEPRVIEALRKVNWKMNSDAGGEISRSKVSLGKTIESEVLGVKDLPDETTLSVPIFANLAMPHQLIRCAIEPDLTPGKESFEFLPFPGEIENAIQRAEERIGELLTDGLDESVQARDVKVCYGQP